MTQTDIILIAAVVALLAAGLVILAKLVVDDIATERKVNKLHESIMSGDIDHLYHMLNRLENEGVIQPYDYTKTARHIATH